MTDFLKSIHKVIDRFVPAPIEHKHVFDSANGIERYDTLLVIQCKCGLGKVLSTGGGK